MLTKSKYCLKRPGKVHANGYQLHPWCQQKEIDAYCQKHGIIVEAYSPLVRNRKANDPTLNAISKSHGKSTAQILIRYCLQKNWVPLPKSDTPSRIIKNADVYDFELSKEDMKTLEGLDIGAHGAIVQAVSNTV
jgi:diketogulonate reductase-like aldo/keto reductase